MARHDDRVTLHQIQDGTSKVLAICQGWSRSHVDSEWVASLALVQLLQIIGEADPMGADHRPS